MKSVFSTWRRGLCFLGALAITFPLVMNFSESKLSSINQVHRSNVPIATRQFEEKDGSQSAVYMPERFYQQEVDALVSDQPATF